MSEEIKICDNEVKDIYTGFKCFKTRFLENKKSIFSDNEVFKKEYLKKIIDSFAKNPDESDSSFDEKIKKQLGNDTEVHELFAHIIWLWSLVASDMKQESKIEDINKWLEDGKKIDTNFVLSFDHGIMSTGQYHKTNKPLELVYIIYFLDKVLNIDPKVGYIEIIKKGVKENIEPFEMSFENGTTRKVAMYNILLHLFEPDSYSSIASYNHKEKIVDFFSNQYDVTFEENDDLDDKYYKVKTKCLEENEGKYPYTWDKIYKDYEFNKLDFYHPDIEKLWKSDIVLESKNMILHGAPGTGKTYSVENTIKNRLEFLKDQNPQKQFKLVQFHPSYSYEDFIDGIKPDGINENGNMKFKLVNGEFKKMCIKAAKELQQNPEKPKQFYFIADEVNRAELSRVFGELLLCLEEDKRLKFINGKWGGTKVKTQNANLWEEEHAVIIENDEYYFGVPENLYFIGTMNDIDRSVDSFDMALRRRFYWKHYRCDYDVIYEYFRIAKGNYPDNLNDYIKICKKLNEKIVSEKDLNLGDSYELGHSYFMKLNSINNTQINKLWENHIAPLLKEYLRAELSQNEIDKKLVELKKEFKI
ncbi:MAG: AAA family ATPase [Sulfurovum sp.]|nr:AAA family ATPase [Sulfurovum sp.]